MRKYDNLILGEGAIFTTNTELTQLNNNVCVIGGSGSGKTHSVIKSCLLEAENSSLIISDPKGALEKEFKDYFRRRGYKVYSVDLINPGESTHSVNLMAIASEEDFIKLSHRIVYCDPMTRNSMHQDPFWNQMCELLFSALLAKTYMVEKEGEETLDKVMQDLPLITRDGDDVVNNTFEQIEAKRPDCFAVAQWRKVRAVAAAEKTWSCVIASLSAILARYSSVEMKAFFQNKNQVNFERFAVEKSVLFLKISDTDATYYNLANIIYAQAIETLCKFADSGENGRCLVPVRLILDDFASNVCIENWPRIMSTIRSRDISAMIILQSLQQLRMAYGEDSATILGNCDSLVFLGGTNCVETAQSLAIRLNKPVEDILYQPRGIVNIFRVGMKPIETTRYDYRKHKNYKELCETLHTSR